MSRWCLYFILSKARKISPVQCTGHSTQCIVLHYCTLRAQKRRTLFTANLQVARTRSIRYPRNFNRIPTNTMHTTPIYYEIAFVSQTTHFPNNLFSLLTNSILKLEYFCFSMIVSGFDFYTTRLYRHEYLKP